MKTFNLPDLGEGLAEGEIREWYVKEGDEVKTEQPLVAIETAKALVDVPSPFHGKIAKLHGGAGDIIKTHAPLVSFLEDNNATEKRSDSGTVVGNIEVGEKILNEAATGVHPVTTGNKSSIKASPAVRALAKALNIDLSTIKASGAENSITLEDVKNASSQIASQSATSTPVQALGEMLRGARRAMALAMPVAYREVVPVTLMDRADISEWAADCDYTVRIIRAVTAACTAEPALNAHFEGKSASRQLFTQVNLGVAVDTPDGLYVPVLKDVKQKTDAQLRQSIDEFKALAQKQAFPKEVLQGATIVLSNFGTIAGRYANPIIMPPTVAIIGIGKAGDEVLAINGKAEVRKVLHLSLTFDHRAATGGEAARFLAALINGLEGST